MNHTRLLAGLLLAAVPALSASAESYKVDPVHSMTVFRITHANSANIYGLVPQPTGTIDTSDGLEMEVTIPVSGILSGHPKRDEHLRAPDFFNVKQYPDATFVSTSANSTGEGTWDVTGDLTIKGVTKTVTVKVKELGTGQGPQGDTRTGFEATFSIQRADYGVDFMPGMLGDTVDLTVAMSGIQQ